MTTTAPRCGTRRASVELRLSRPGASCRGLSSRRDRQRTRSGRPEGTRPVGSRRPGASGRSRPRSRCRRPPSKPADRRSPRCSRVRRDRTPGCEDGPRLRAFARRATRTACRATRGQPGRGASGSPARSRQGSSPRPPTRAPAPSCGCRRTRCAHPCATTPAGSCCRWCRLASAARCRCRPGSRSRCCAAALRGRRRSCRSRPRTRRPRVRPRRARQANPRSATAAS